MRKLGDTDVLNKTVALRVDLNVPIKPNPDPIVIIQQQMR